VRYLSLWFGMTFIFHLIHKEYMREALDYLSKKKRNTGNTKVIKVKFNYIGSRQEKRWKHQSLLKSELN